jgi:hypothetical protein
MIAGVADVVVEMANGKPLERAPAARDTTLVAGSVRFWEWV